MKQRTHGALDFVASLLCIFNVDWDSDFGDDGYRDLWGREPIGQPVWRSDVAAPQTRKRQPIFVVRTGRAKASGS